MKNTFFPTFIGAEPGDPLPRAAGFNAAADLVTQTVDGRNLNDLWNEFQTTISMQNEQRDKIVQLLTFPVTANTESVPQVSSARFERASEYGEPKGMRPKVASFQLGYDFNWYDLAARYTWMFLAEAPASQIEANNALALEADNVLIFEEVMKTLYAGNTNRLADIDGQQDVNVYGLYNADGTVPPKYKNRTFDGTHNHYMVSGAAQIMPGDLEDLAENITEHGYTRAAGYRHVLFVASREAKRIQMFERGTDGASHSFIPAQGAPTDLLPIDQEFTGPRPPATYGGLEVAGSYGVWMVVVDDLFPEGYIAGIATGGPENLNNPVGFRQHNNTSLRGLRLVKGPNPDYPLIDSFYQRGFGTGIRQRGGSAVMQIKASGAYTPPASYLVD